MKTARCDPSCGIASICPAIVRHGYAWTFPKGAIVGEVLAMTGPDGYAYTFEMRMRTREYGYWDMDVMRPFPHAADLAKRIKELRPDWQDQPNLVKAVEHLEQPIAMKELTLADHQPAKRTFSQTMGVDSLPSLGDDKLVGQLLTSTKFRSTAGEVWREASNGSKTYAPTTEASFHVVPAKYDAGFVQVDRTSCMRCHDSVSKPVSDFNPGRDWYGHIRGSDGIFSFQPFSNDSISDNGYGRAVSMRPEFEKAGVIAKYDPKRHPEAIYQSATSRAELIRSTFIASRPRNPGHGRPGFFIDRGRKSGAGGCTVCSTGLDSLRSDNHDPQT